MVQLIIFIFRFFYEGSGLKSLEILFDNDESKLIPKEGLKVMENEKEMIQITREIKLLENI